MARPSPVPPYRRVVELSACVKAWKMCCCFSGGMPIPVSIDDEVQRATAGPVGALDVDVQHHFPLGS